MVVHVDMAAPVSHILFLQGRAQPDRLRLLDMAPKELSRQVLYFAASIITWCFTRMRRAKDLDTLDTEVNTVLRTPTRPNNAAAGARTRRVSQAPQKYLQNGNQTNFNDEEPPVGVLRIDHHLRHLRWGARSRIPQELKKAFDADIATPMRTSRTLPSACRTVVGASQSTMEPKQIEHRRDEFLPS